MDRREPQVLTDALLRFDPYRSLERQILAGSYPVELQEAEPAFLAFLTALLTKRLKSSLLIVTPSDREAEDFSLDLEFFGIGSRLLPWWKTAAYRPAAVRSKVFGDRASVLADLCQGDARILVASHRALVTPVPPRDYFASKLRPLEKGASADPGEIADTLASYGYLRVPRVALPGEFAQRGEVIDLFMPGDDQAIRIHLDYDKIARITSFDPEIQSGGRERGACLLRPLKEIIWDSSMASALAQKAETLPGCFLQSGCRAVACRPKAPLQEARTVAVKTHVICRF